MVSLLEHSQRARATCDVSLAQEVHQWSLVTLVIVRLMQNRFRANRYYLLISLEHRRCHNSPNTSA